MNTYQLTLYFDDGGVSVHECKRMEIKEAWDFFRNYVNKPGLVSLKMEIFK